MIEIASNLYTELQKCNRIIVGFSGGLDSTSLLYFLAKIPNFEQKVCAVHVNHGLSPNANAWQRHCKSFCELLNIQFISHEIHIPNRANLEEEARVARYRVFSEILQSRDLLVLAHHADDQAETLLLHLFRGAGIDGMSAMLDSAKFSNGKLIRPLLNITRQNLLDYAKANQLTWIEDESNEDVTLTRNYLRHNVLPVIKTRWPNVVGNLLRTTQHCQTAKKNLESLAMLDLPNLDKDVLPIAKIIELDRSRIENVLRTWILKHKVRPPSTKTFNRIIDEVLFSRHDKIPCVSFGNVIIRRYDNELHWLLQSMPITYDFIEWSNFPSDLQLPAGLGVLHASYVLNNLSIPAKSILNVRFRRGGEKIRLNGQTKSLKKLMQTLKVPVWQRDSIPLIYADDSLVAVVGHAISDGFLLKSSLH